MALLSADQERNAAVFRASWPNPGHLHAMQDNCSAAAVAPNRRRSWWAAFNNETRGRNGKRRRSRAVPKPPVTQLSAQDKAHFKRMVELFTGLGSSPVNSCLSKSARAAPDQLFLSSSSSPNSAPSPCLPPLSQSLLSSPYTQLDLDIISALRTPIATQLPSSRLNTVPSSYKDSDNLALHRKSHDPPLPITSPYYGDEVLSHDQNEPKNTFSISSSAFTSNLSSSSLTIQLHNNSTNTNPNSSSTSCANDDPNDQIDLKSFLASTPCASDDPCDQFDLKSLLASPTSVDSSSKPLDIQVSNHLEDSCHLLCFGGDCSTVSGVSCSFDDKHHHDTKWLGVKIRNTINHTNHKCTSNPCSHDLAIYNHADKCRTFGRGLNAPSQKKVIKEEEDMEWEELPLINTDNTYHKQAQQQVQDFEKQVKELENFLFKENDKIDNPFSPMRLFLKQHALYF